MKRQKKKRKKKADYIAVSVTDQFLQKFISDRN